MPIPSTHKARVRVQYVGDDGQPYSVHVPASWQALGIDPSMAIVADNELAAHPALPANIKPRHLAIETTNGEDDAGKYHVYRRTVPFNVQDVSGSSATLKIGNAIADFEGCAWVVRGRVGEKRVDR